MMPITELEKAQAEQIRALEALRVKCPKCGAKPGRDCNPHRDKVTAVAIYRAPHARRIQASQRQGVEQSKKGGG